MARRYIAGDLLRRVANKSRRELSNIRKYHLLSSILVIIYAVGMTGILFNVHSKFIYLTPFNLLISFLIVLYAHPGWNLRITVFIIAVFLAGYVVEVWGVQSGLIFGSYEYGDVLGPKWRGTPYVIGWNWVMLTYCCGVTVNRLMERVNWFGKALVGALLMVSLDILIEPVAIHYNFWSWGPENIVPMRNYVAWGVISFVFLSVFALNFKDLRNKTGFTLFILQFVFFLIIGIDW